MVHTALEAASALAADGIDAAVIDPRNYLPLDETSILESVRKTGRLVVVDEFYPRCSLATDISALVADQACSGRRGAHDPLRGPPAARWCAAHATTTPR